MQPFAKLVSAILVSLPVISSAKADLVAQFDEGAPKDRFTFTNTGNCSIVGATVRLDLSGSRAGLIFDTTGSGAGVEVFQPLEIVSGAGSIIGVSEVNDGDTAMEIRVGELKSNASIAFTVDVDDTLGGREITVSDAEIAGAGVALVMGGRDTEAAFDSTTQAVLPIPDC